MFKFPLGQKVYFIVNDNSVEFGIITNRSYEDEIEDGVIRSWIEYYLNYDSLYFTEDKLFSSEEDATKALNK